MSLYIPSINKQKYPNLQTRVEAAIVDEEIPKMDPVLNGLKFLVWLGRDPEDTYCRG